MSKSIFSDKEAFDRYIASLPSNEELLRRMEENAAKDPNNVRRPGENPIDFIVRRFMGAELKYYVVPRPDKILISCPACGKDVYDTDGRCKRCMAMLHKQETRQWWEGEIELGVTICSCCNERLSVMMKKIPLVKIKSWSGGTISYYESSVTIPVCKKCNFKSCLPFIGKRVLDRNILLHYMFGSGCGLGVASAPLM